MKTADPAGLCPQTRGTSPAPEPYTGMANILPASKENLAAGKQLFHQDTKPITCETCHGFKGNGFGVIFAQMQPYPRDFTCYQTMKEVSDGQLFWIIKHGSHGTRMKLFKNLQEDEIWQLVHYVRHFAD
jgi:mono/diheme cytochrome c family protein